jgi:uncharacterized protein (TIGR03382 family)
MYADLVLSYGIMIELLVASRCSSLQWCPGTGAGATLPAAGAVVFSVGGRRRADACRLPA